MGVFKAGGPVAAVAQQLSSPDQYLVEVNKNDLNVGRMTVNLNTKWRAGWRLAQALEQNGNTVMVFERRA